MYGPDAGRDVDNPGPALRVAARQRIHRLPGPVLPPAEEPLAAGLPLVNQVVDVSDRVDVLVEPPLEVVVELVLEEGPDLVGARLVGHAREEAEVEDYGVWALGAYRAQQGRDVVVDDMANLPVVAFDPFSCRDLRVDDVLNRDVVDSAVDQSDVDLSARGGRHHVDLPEHGREGRRHLPVQSQRARLVTAVKECPSRGRVREQERIGVDEGLLFTGQGANLRARA